MCEGDGMEEWKECKLSDIVEINPTESLKKGTVAKKIGMDVLQPYCRAIPSFSFEPYTGGTKFKNGDTIMARITPCLENGKTAMVNILDDNEIGFGSTEYIVFRAKNNITDPYFVYYLVTSDCIRNPAIKSMVGSSGRQRVQTDVVANLTVKVPPLPTQQKIAAILSSLDDKIELNNKINTNLEQQAQALFKNWFVDFEPFGGKMPEGWKECKAEEYFEITIGKTPPRKEQEWFSEEKTNQTMKWVSISDMGSCGLFISDSSEYLTTEAVAKFNVKVVPANTIILSFKLTVGRIAITDDEMCTNEAIAHFGTKNKVINEYLYLYLKNFNYQTMGSTSSIATAVNSKIIKAMPFILPDEKTINNFHQATNSLFEKIRENQHENRTLTTIRNTLLPKLMNGEIEVGIK